MSEQLMLDFGTPAAAAGPREFRAGNRTLRVSECFDVYWRFAAERQRIFHQRAAGSVPPWTADPVLGRHKFTNVYRAADRVSQYLIRDVVYAGPQDPEEVVFRVLLFKVFNRIQTWELLAGELGQAPSWERYDFAACDRVLGNAMRRGEKVYSAAYIVPNPPFGQARKHGNHLRLIEYAMTSGLPAKVGEAADLREVYGLLAELPSLGPFLAYQYAVDLAYSAVTTAEEPQFVVPGPGAVDGISKCFTDTGGLSAAEVIAWMAGTSREHFARLGLEFTGLWGRWPTLIDWQNVFCEVSKYTRARPHRAQAAQPGGDGVLPFLPGPGGDLQGVGHLPHVVQQPRVRGASFVPAALAGVAEHSPRDRLIGHRGPAAVLDVIDPRVRAALQPGQAPEDRRPAQACGVREVQGVMPAVARLPPGVVGQRAADAEPVDRHPDRLPERAGLGPQRDLQEPGNRFARREPVIEEFLHHALRASYAGRIISEYIRMYQESAA